jgi:hypothetical protein
LLEVYPVLRSACLAAVCALLLAACGSGSAHAQRPTTTTRGAQADGPPTPEPSLGLKYGALLGRVPATFVAFSKVVDSDHHPDGDVLYRQAEPVIVALRALDAALIQGSAPHRIADDMATLVLTDEELLVDFQHLPGLTGERLAGWEEVFSEAGTTEQRAFSDVLFDFGLPSVGNAP